MLIGSVLFLFSSYGMSRVIDRVFHRGDTDLSVQTLAVAALFLIVLACVGFLVFRRGLKTFKERRTGNSRAALFPHSKTKQAAGKADIEREALINTIDKKVRDLSLSHIRTLIKKKKQLARFDEYGSP